MSDKLKKLTGKNPKDFEPVAFSLVNDVDVDLFKELVDSEDYLFDFVKNNVARRIEKVCNKDNFLNLIPFLKYYSPYFCDIIVGILVKFADEDLTDNLLELFESGTDDEKAYCARYFAYIQDPLSFGFLQNFALSDSEYLMENCAKTLRQIGDREIYATALLMLKNGDDFEKLKASKFLSYYGDDSVISEIIDSAKNSGMSENICAEAVYLKPLSQIFEDDFDNALYVLNQIINGLGEIISLSCVIDFEIYQIFDYLINCEKNSKINIVLYNAKEKFNILTENDEYLFDESKEVKSEVFEIKKLLSSIDIPPESFDNEIDEGSDFVFTALDFTFNYNLVRNLLKSKNPTVIFKAVETLKRLNNLTGNDKKLAIENVDNENIKSIINAI